jgi:uncharacterized protein (TIGR00661 family)
MKILYGVVGEGMGHAIRSSVVLDKLVADGHEVHIVASGRAVDFLSERFGEVTEIWGLSIVVEDNEVKNRLTAAKNLKGALAGLPGNVARFFEVERDFDPDVVISDFETWSWSFAKLFNVPVICIDNIQIINRCKHDSSITVGHEEEFRLTKSIVKSRTAGADQYLVTTFFYPEVRKKRTTLVPPILRDAILDATPTDGDHLLVYQTSDTFKTLPDLLAQLDVPVRVYGLRRDVTEPVVEGNITYCPFSNQGFVDDLASCRGVVASAGFTLLGEAVHLGKPYLATPVRKQFEQILNSRYLEALGYGTYDLDLDLATLRNFVGSLDRHREALEGYERHENTKLFEELDAFLDRVAAGLE